MFLPNRPLDSHEQRQHCSSVVSSYPVVLSFEKGERCSWTSLVSTPSSLAFVFLRFCVFTLLTWLPSSGVNPKCPICYLYYYLQHEILTLAISQACWISPPKIKQKFALICLSTSYDARSHSACTVSFPMRCPSSHHQYGRMAWVGVRSISIACLSNNKIIINFKILLPMA